MKKSTAAWAIQHPNKTILTDMVRAKRTEAITALTERIARHKSLRPWHYLYEVGFRVVRVWVTCIGDVKKVGA